MVPLEPLIYPKLAQRYSKESHGYSNDIKFNPSELSKLYRYMHCVLKFVSKKITRYFSRKISFLGFHWVPWGLKDVFVVSILHTLHDILIRMLHSIMYICTLYESYHILYTKKNQLFVYTLVHWQVLLSVIVSL